MFGGGQFSGNGFAGMGGRLPGSARKMSSHLSEVLLQGPPTPSLPQTCIFLKPPFPSTPRAYTLTQTYQIIKETPIDTYEANFS